jgi:prepilin-type N-terminal cleavage/methylation domain-containing protein
MKKRKGFTLIELLAVIVILGLLMAIAIPSVTKYITESRKKTLTTTVGNYIGALVNEVNDLSYTFTGQNTIYAVPIECISLERGGTNPFGHWYQANDAYFAYVLIQYDDVNSKYVYGFTFKDSAGYGLYPTIQEKINEKGSQVKTGYTINKPVTGDLTSLVTLAKWQESGFKVDFSTHLQVLTASSEGQTGDGINTCTLAQKGDNYDAIEQEKEAGKSTLANLIKKHNTLITEIPTLTATSNDSGDVSGLYLSNDTNNGDATYYFRGDVKNNNVEFAMQNWKVIRINEDGTVRLILNGRVNNLDYQFNSESNRYTYMYYSNSDIAKPTVDNWYQTNIVDKGYDLYVASGDYFCEQAKVKCCSSYYTSGSATMSVYTSYTPDFKCTVDGNGKGYLVDASGKKVGLMTYDELIYAGGYYNKYNSKYYLYNGSYGLWTMSPAGFWDSMQAYTWYMFYQGNVLNRNTANSSGLRPVINLNANVIATGTGTSSDPYVVQTN